MTVPSAQLPRRSLGRQTAELVVGRRPSLAVGASVARGLRPGRGLWCTHRRRSRSSSLMRTNAALRPPEIGRALGRSVCRTAHRPAGRSAGRSVTRAVAPVFGALVVASVVPPVAASATLARFKYDALTLSVNCRHLEAASAERSSPLQFDTNSGEQREEQGSNFGS